MIPKTQKYSNLVDSKIPSDLYNKLINRQIKIMARCLLIKCK